MLESVIFKSAGPVKKSSISSVLVMVWSRPCLTGSLFPQKSIVLMSFPKPTATIAPTMHGGSADPSSSSATVVFTPTPMLNLTAAHLARSAVEWPKMLPQPSDTTILDANNNNVSELQKFANKLKMEKLARKRLAYKNRAAMAAAARDVPSTVVTSRNLQLPPPHLVVKTSKLNVNAPIFIPKTTIAGSVSLPKSTTAVVTAPISYQPSLHISFCDENRTSVPIRKEEVFNARDIAFPPDLEDREKDFGFKFENIRRVENSSLEAQASTESQGASVTSSSENLKIRTSQVGQSKIALVQNWNLSYDPSRGPSSSSFRNVENYSAIDQKSPDDENEQMFTIASTNCLRIYDKVAENFDKEQMFDVYRSLKESGGVPRPACLSREFDNEAGIFQPWKWIESEWQNDKFRCNENFSTTSMNKDQNDNDDGRMSQNGLRRAFVNDQVNRLMKKGMTNFVSRQLVNAMTNQLKLNQ
uniref:Uncharacterized protein n=1 Tax=Romanomermis culicivorax TaxID=13658 RepID=A0A915IJX1_ROMCU